MLYVTNFSLLSVDLQLKDGQTALTVSVGSGLVPQLRIKIITKTHRESKLKCQKDLIWKDVICRQGPDPPLQLLH